MSLLHSQAIIAIFSQIYIYRINALFVFIVIAIGAHGNSFFYDKTIFYIQMTGTIICGFILFLFARSDERRRSQADSQLWNYDYNYCAR